MVNCYDFFFCVGRLSPTQQGCMRGDFAYHFRGKKKKSAEEEKKGGGFFFFCEEALMDSHSALAELGVA